MTSRSRSPSLREPAMRILRSFGGWALLLVFLVALFCVAAPEAHRPRILNIATLAGTLLLAVPAIRLNEQGRLIERVRGLQAGIAAIKENLEGRELAADVRARQEATLKARQGSLEKLIGNLTTGKGAWTSWVHNTLYAGYVLILSAALARAFG